MHYPLPRQKQLDRLKRLERLDRLKQLKRLDRLERLERLKRLVIPADLAALCTPARCRLAL